MGDIMNKIGALRRSQMDLGLTIDMPGGRLGGGKGWWGKSFSAVSGPLLGPEVKG